MMQSRHLPKRAYEDPCEEAGADVQRGDGLDDVHDDLNRFRVRIDLYKGLPMVIVR